MENWDIEFWWALAIMVRSADLGLRGLVFAAKQLNKEDEVSRGIVLAE